MLVNERMKLDNVEIQMLFDWIYDKKSMRKKGEKINELYTKFLKQNT